MANPFDQFDQGNPFDQFDSREKPKAIGQAANADFLRAELEAADPFTRNLAAAGSALSDTWEGLKQWLGKEDKERLAANKVMAEAAPAGRFAGEVAQLAIPFGGVTGVKAAAAVGGALGATRPVEGEGLEMLFNKAKSVATDAALGGVGQKVANLATKAVANKIASNQAAQRLNAPRDKVLQEALDRGFVTTPSSVNPTWWNQLKESVGGKIATAQTASNRNAQLFEQAARRDLGIADEIPLTPEVTKAVRAQAYQEGYKPIADLQAINWDPDFVRGVASLSPASRGGAIESPAQAAIDKLVTSLANRGQWTGEQLIFDIRTLREQAKANFNSARRAGGDAEKEALARAQGDAAKLLEGLAERNIIRQGGSPEAVQAMREARVRIAKAHDVEDAMIPGGGVDARKWVKKADKMSGEMKLAAMFASQFPKASQTPQQIAGPGVSSLRTFGSMLLGAGGAAAGGAPGMAAAAIPLVVPPVARAQMLSRRAQRNALRDLYRLGLPTITANRLLQYAPVGLTVGGREAFAEDGPF